MLSRGEPDELWLEFHVLGAEEHIDQVREHSETCVVVEDDLLRLVPGDDGIERSIEIRGDTPLFQPLLHPESQLLS